MSSIAYLLAILFICLHALACSARLIRAFEKNVAAVQLWLPSDQDDLRSSYHEKISRKQVKEAADSEISTSPNGDLVKEKIRVLFSSSSVDMIPQRSESKVWKMEGRRMLKSQKDAEERVETKENEFGEDVVVMDYAQPHRKPPIHNKEP